MSSIFKQFLHPQSKASMRRKSEVVTPEFRVNGELLSSAEASAAADECKSRRHSVPATRLDTIDENEHLSVKNSKKLFKMNLSPSQRNSPKEKRSFTFFRSRTLSSSSAESSSGPSNATGIGTNAIATATSPRLSPRTIFDKVRRRSEKSSSVDGVPPNLSPTQHALQLQLQQHLQQQLLQQQQQQQQQDQDDETPSSSPSNSSTTFQQQKQKYLGPQFNGSTRKHLSHSISEENDESLNNELNNYQGVTTSATTGDLTLNSGSNGANSQSSILTNRIILPFNQSQSIERPILFKMTSNTPSNISSNSIQGAFNMSSSNSLSGPSPSLTHLHHQQSILRQTSASPHNLFFDLDNGITSVENNQIFAYFMKHKYCYDIMPKSAKIVVFDTQLLVKKAFFALIYNGVRAAPLWDSKNQKFIGMLTITDFILILQKYYRQPNAKIEELEEHKIETWREVLKEYNRPFVYLKPEDTLFDAIKILTKYRVHRLPIIDPITGNVVCIVTHKRILRYLYLFIYDMPHPTFLQQSIADLKVGSFDKIKTIKQNTSITEALHLFVTTHVSALPVVDDQGKLVNIYSKFDVIDLAAEKTYTNLDIPVIEALEYRRNRFDGVTSCHSTESLGSIMERIVKKEVHRLVIVDAENHVQGIISLSDILTYIVLTQGELSELVGPKNAQDIKTATLTQAFGQTRLSSEASIGDGADNQSASKISRTSGPRSRQVPSPLTMNMGVEQPIFEDDPMETEPVK